MLNYRLYRITYKIRYLPMRYMDLIDNFVMVVKFDEYICLTINLMNLDLNWLCYHYIFVDKLCTLINPKILIN